MELPSLPPPRDDGSADAPAPAPGAEYTIGGVTVHFPHKAYASQVAMMSGVIRACDQSQSALLESPTGASPRFPFFLPLRGVPCPGSAAFWRGLYSKGLVGWW